MNQWISDELARLGAADELEIAPPRPDGTRRKPVTIWVVRVGDEPVSYTHLTLPTSDLV